MDYRFLVTIRECLKLEETSKIIKSNLLCSQVYVSVCQMLGNVLSQLPVVGAYLGWCKFYFP